MRRVAGRLLLVYLSLEAAFAFTALALASRVRSSGDAESNDVTLVAAFSGRQMRSRAPAFASAELLAAYGGIFLDLRGATPSPEGMKVRARAFRGGVAIQVPHGWRVDMNGRAFAGGVADQTEHGSSEDAPRLDVDAMAVMGGIVVRHEFDSHLTGNAHATEAGSSASTDSD